MPPRSGISPRETSAEIQVIISLGCDHVLAGEKVEVEKGGIKIIINGNMEITSITINESLAKESLEGMLVDCLNEAIKKTQRLMAQKMQELGGIPGLS